MEDSTNRTMTTLPDGNYKVVSFALDLTGKKLIDEICHIGAYVHPDKGFSQYVMPYRDMSRSATRTHGIRIFTNFGRFRVLKDIRSMKTLRTKSEFSTLNEFIDWMRKAAESTDGIILTYHDNNLSNVLPFLMDGLRRYKLMDDFFGVVKAFVNCHKIAADLLEQKDRAFSLRALLRSVLEYNDEKLNANPLENAKNRAQLTYQVMAKLLKVEGEVSSDLLRNFVTGKDEEMINLEKQITLAQKVKSLRPIFVSQIRKGPKERSRAVILRRYLIEIETDYASLQRAFESGSRDGIAEVVGPNLAKKKKQDFDDLVDLVFAHFSGGIKADTNGNKMTGVSQKNIGGGEGIKTSTSSIETDDEDEFEEAEELELEMRATEIAV